MIILETVMKIKGIFVTRCMLMTTHNGDDEKAHIFVTLKVIIKKHVIKFYTATLLQKLVPL